MKDVTIGTYTEGSRTYRFDLDIEIDAKGELHISGLVWDTRISRDCVSAGQIIGELAKIVNFAPGWDRAKVRQLAAIWQRWHLNHMRAACEHQRALGWPEKASQTVTLYHYRLRSEIAKERRENEREALAQLRSGATVKLDERGQTLAALPPERTEPYQLADSDPYYEPRTPLYSGARPETETKALGWLKPEEHPEGILCRPCPECGYKYGSAWLKEELPAEVVTFIRSLEQVPA